MRSAREVKWQARSVSEVKVQEEAAHPPSLSEPRGQPLKFQVRGKKCNNLLENLGVNLRVPSGALCMAVINTNGERNLAVVFQTNLLARSVKLLTDGGMYGLETIKLTFRKVFCGVRCKRRFLVIGD